MVLPPRVGQEARRSVSPDSSESGLSWWKRKRWTYSLKVERLMVLAAVGLRMHTIA